MEISSNKSHGFSLVELMVVISIVSVIASIGLGKYEIFRAKAKQVEIISSMGNIRLLYHSYKATFDAEPPVIGGGQSQNNWFDSQNTTTSDSCNRSENPIGFKIADCRKSHYLYIVNYGDTATPTLVNVTMMERQINGKLQIYSAYCGERNGGILSVDEVYFMSETPGLTYNLAPYNNHLGNYFFMYKASDCAVRQMR